MSQINVNFRKRERLGLLGSDCSKWVLIPERLGLLEMGFGKN